MANRGKFQKEELRAAIIKLLSFGLAAFGLEIFNENEIGAIATVLVAFILLAYDYAKRKI